MSFKYINDAYRTCYKRGDQILFMTRLVTIVGSRGQYLRCRDDLGRFFLAHPTWRIEKVEKEQEK